MAPERYCNDCEEYVDPLPVGTCPICYEDHALSDRPLEVEEVRPPASAEGGAAPEGGASTDDSLLQLARHYLPGRRILGVTHLSWVIEAGPGSTIVQDMGRALLSGALGMPAPFLVKGSYDQEGVGLLVVDEKDIHFLDLSGKQPVHQSGPRNRARVTIEALGDDHSKLTLTGEVNGTWELHDVPYEGNRGRAAELQGFLDTSELLGSDDPLTAFLVRSILAYREGAFAEIFGEAYTQYVRDTNLDVIVDEVVSDDERRAALEVTLAEITPRPDEVYLFIVPESCVLTNQRMVLLDKSGVLRVLELSEIQSYRTKGLWTHREWITLHSGEVIERKKLEVVVEAASLMQIVGSYVPPAD